MYSGRILGTGLFGGLALAWLGITGMAGCSSPAPAERAAPAAEKTPTINLAPTSSTTSLPPAGATSAALSGPYEDPLQAEVPFGRRTWWLAPWRAYMDTWPARQFSDALGITLNVTGAEGAAAAEVLGAAGFRHARLEWGWGHLTWAGDRFSDDAERRGQLAVLKLQGLRPLILLNGHHGQPCPVREVPVTLREPAAAGSRTLRLADVSAVRPGYTGLRGQGEAVAFPLITRCDAASGQCELSAPLTAAIGAGPLTLIELKYQPFSGAKFADGRANPASAETVRGWLDYVAVVCATARAGLGTEHAADAGFDLEVWNEYTFGSNFLDLANYCEPKPVFAEPISYHGSGREARDREARGVEAILPMTVDWVGEHCPGTQVISGFANQRPWDNGTEMWPGQAGISRHYYTSWSPLHLAPGDVPHANSGPLDALGRPEGTPDGKDWHTVVPGSFFVPAHQVALPEQWFYAYQTEFLVRDLQPWPSAGFPAHFRYAQPGTGRPAAVWNSETNCDRAGFANALIAATHCAPDDPRLARLLHALAARSLLRQLVFSTHKGVSALTIYAARSSDREFAVLPEEFYRLVAASGGTLSAAARAAVGPQVATIARTARFFANSEPLDVARKLTLDQLVEHDPQLVFRGDGTAAHPDRWQRDDFACLPFQFAADRFAIGYYVVTRDVTRVRNAAQDVFAPERYTLPPQTYDLTLGNVCGLGAQVSAWDPLTDQSLPVQVLAATATTVTVRVVASDAPRFLSITERAPGPLVDVRLEPLASGAAVVLTGNCPGTASITWGPYPQRVPAGGAARPPVEITLTPGVAQRVALTGATASDAVQVTYHAAGLVARWPQWPYDVRGRLGFANAPNAATSHASGLPPLPAGRATAFTLSAAWQGQTLTVAEGVSARVESLAGKPETALPPISVLDHREIRIATWNGIPAWQISDALDPVAHPGETRLAREQWLCRLADGWLLLTLRGASAATLTPAVCERTAASVTLSSP